MSRGWQVRESVGAPVETVWAALVDLPAATRWLPGVERLEIVDDDGEPIEPPPPIADGTRYRFYARGGAHIGRVARIEPGELLALSADHGGVTATYEYRLEDLGDDVTRVTLDAWCEAPGIWRVFEPVLHFLMRKSDSDQLAALRRVIREDREA